MVEDQRDMSLIYVLHICVICALGMSYIGGWMM